MDKYIRKEVAYEFNLDKWNKENKGKSRKQLKLDLISLELENEYLRRKLIRSNMIHEISTIEERERLHHEAELRHKIFEQQKYINALEDQLEPSCLQMILSVFFRTKKN